MFPKQVGNPLLQHNLPLSSLTSLFYRSCLLDSSTQKNGNNHFGKIDLDHAVEHIESSAFTNENLVFIAQMHDIY